MKKLIAAMVLLLAVAVSAAPTGSIKARKGVAHPSPALTVSGPRFASYWPKGFHDLYATMLSNLHMPNPFYPHRYAWPSPAFPGAYLWDTAFISQAWRPWDPATADEIDQTVLDHQAPDGRLLHFASPFSKSEYTQPPVLAWAVWENYQWSRNKKFLAGAYETLKKYNAWLYANRRQAGGLFFWAHPYESGIDNSPRFGGSNEHDYRDMKTLAAVDLCSYIVRQNESLSAMAQELGREEERAFYTRRAEELRALIDAKLWDEETGLYYDLDTATGKLVKIKTIASLFPMLAGVPGPERAARMRDHVMNPDEFNTPFPLPSVALDDPTFQKDCWRGPVWINTAYMAIMGMERYGYRAEAAELAFGVADGVFRNYKITHQFVEFYDPVLDGFGDLHRKRGNLYKKLTLGDKPKPRFAGWTALANTIVIENLIGLHCNAGAFSLRPNFPPAAAGASFTLDVPGYGMTIKMDVGEGGATKGSVMVGGKETKFDLKSGESLDLQ